MGWGGIYAVSRILKILKGNNMTTPPPRDIEFYCEYCDIDFVEMVDFGNYVKMKEGTNVYIVKERPGVMDIFVKTVVCNKCGCCSGLSLKNK